MSATPKKTENSTPMQNAIRHIRTAWIVAFVSAAITLIAALTSFMDDVDVFMAIDGMFVLVLGILLLILKSRVAVILLLVHYLGSSIIMFMEGFLDFGVGTLMMRIAFICAYFYGILGAFSYHKLKKQENTAMQEGTGMGHESAGMGMGYGATGTGQWGAPYNVDPRFAIPTTPAIKEDTPAGKVILEHTHENLNIALKRTASVTELVVNGMVYAQKEEGLLSGGCDLSVYAENALIRVHKDTVGSVYIYVNGNLVKSK